MAFRKVDAPPEEPRGEFVKFNAIGDKFGGVFISYKKTEPRGTFNKPEHHYAFKNKNGTFILNAPYDLHQKLQHASPDKKTAIQPGWKAIMKFDSKQAFTKSDGTPGHKDIFEVMIDDDVKSAPPPPPSPAPEEDPFA